MSPLTRQTESPPDNALIESAADALTGTQAMVYSALADCVHEFRVLAQISGTEPSASPC